MDYVIDDNVTEKFSSSVKKFSLTSAARIRTCIVLRLPVHMTRFCKEEIRARLALTITVTVKSANVNAIKARGCLVSVTRDRQH